MNINLGKVDRVARMVIGLGLVILALFSGLEMFSSKAMSSAGVAVGVVLYATALAKFCPVYRIFGIRTCKA